MQLINVLKRLNELDSKNPRVSKSKKIKDESTGPQGQGEPYDDTSSAISGNQRGPHQHNNFGISEEKENTMENLDKNSLQYLAGVKKTIEECGMMGAVPNPNMPASINVTAGSAEELSGMLKDIMGLAGVHKVEPQHMPVDNPTSGPSKVISSPPMKADPQKEPDMKSLLSMMDVEPEVDEDSMNIDNDDQRMYNTSPREKGQAWGNWAMDGDQDNRVVAAKDKLVNREGIAEQLWAKYEKFINENEDCNCTPKGEKCPVHGMKECSNYMKENVKPKCCCKVKGKKKCPVHGKMEEGFRPLLPQQKIAGKKADLQAIAQSGRIGSGPGPEMANGGTGRVPFQSKEYTKYIRDRAAKAKKALSNMEEAKKPSAGMSKKAKSKLVKKAKKGGDIGKKGKNFEKVAKAAGGGEKGKRIAAAAMWKNAAKK